MTRGLLSGVLAIVLAAAGCAETIEYQYVGTEIVRNDEGHVVGHKELLIDARDGREFEQVTNYVPMYNDKGDIVGYQEPIRGGAVIRSPDGRRIGARYTDLRSRGSNPGSEGLTITIQPPP